MAHPGVSTEVATQRAKPQPGGRLGLALSVLALLAGLGSAGRAIWTGAFAMPFWVGLVGVGLVVPLVLSLVMKPRAGHAGLMTALASLLILIGGFALRYVIVFVGQS